MVEAVPSITEIPLMLLLEELEVAVPEPKRTVVQGGQALNMQTDVAADLLLIAELAQAAVIIMVGLLALIQVVVVVAPTVKLETAAAA